MLFARNRHFEAAELQARVHTAGLRPKRRRLEVLVARGDWRGTAAYHASRWVGYALLGLVAGGFGSAITGIDPRFQRYLPVTLAALMLLSATGLIDRLTGRLRLPPLVTQHLPSRSPILSAAIVGGLTVLLPCGVLYAAVPMAAATGSAANGSIFLGLFAIASAPGLLFPQLIHRLLPQRWVKATQRVLLVMAAALLLLRAVAMGAPRVAGATPSCHDVSRALGQ